MSRDLLAAPTAAACALALGVLGSLTPSTAQAQGVYKWETLEKRVDSAQIIVALGTDVFGDSVSLQTGTLAFSVTDVDIPGNNALPVRFTRSYQVANTRGSGGQYMLADWTVEVPRISGRFATDWLAGTSLNRCSSATLAPAVPAGLETHFQHYDFWQGLRLEIPGVGGGELLQISPSVAKPYDPANPTLDYRWTTDGQIQLHCIGTLANRVGGGEGFVAVTPDGTRYRFDYMAQRELPTMTEVQTWGVNGLRNQTKHLEVRENTLYATEVTDRFGNTVNYSYTNAWNQPGRLERIASSDGRQIDIIYDVAGPTGKIDQVKAGTPTNPGTRIWNYDYDVDNSPAPRPTLNLVTLPDSTTWVIQFNALSYSPILYPGRKFNYEDGAIRSCSELPEVINGGAGVPAPAIISGTVTHPSGASATFELDVKPHTRSHVTMVCENYTLGGPTQTNDPQDDNPQWVNKWHDWSLKSKQITGPGLTTMTWQYAYEADQAVLFYKGPNGQPTCTGASCPLPNCSSSDCSRQSRTIVTLLPQNTKERYTFGITWQYDEGKLLKVDRGFTAPSSAMESVTHTYDLSRTNQTYPAKFGTSLRNTTDGYTSEYHRPKTSTVTSRDGATFSWIATSFDALARPTGVTKTSSLGFSKTESYGYASHPAKWVLQQQSTHVDGIETTRAVFDPTYATMTEFYAFNQRQQTIGYDTTSTVASGLKGTVSSVMDGNNQTTYLSSWHRGVPRTITYPGSLSETAEVDDFGFITSTTDELGNKTCFRSDAMGRTDLITRPSESQPGVCDASAWLTTSIVYSKVASIEFGIPANHWRRTETTGSSVKETYYDGLWRPILERQRATDASAGERFVRKDFDYAGRETLASYPVGSVSTYDTVTTGVDTVYDALGRVTGTSADSELGLLTTSTAYLTPFKTEHTNARGKVTTTTYQAFDTPSYDAPLLTASGLTPAPESITSTYTRNAFGNPVTLTREGVWTNPNTTPPTLETISPVARTFVYDDYQRLCKTIEPDAGVSVFEYDAAGNLAWKATGQNTLTSTTDCQRSSVPATSRSVHAYDGRNRLLGINHPAGTDDVGYTYFADGAIQTATVGTLSSLAPITWSATRNAWTYTYNKRRLLESESLALDGKTFLLDWSYANNGAVTGLTYPSTHAVTFNPNAYGEPRQVGTYATGATYHASGLLTNFTYGNSATRAITLATAPNTRNLPGRIYDSRAGVNLLDHTFTYDGNGNLTSITDGVVDPEGQPSESRTLGYDERDRLISVTGAASGNETYTYDPLDRTRRTVINGVDRRFHVNPTTHRLSQITTAGSPVVMDYAWNDRGELTGRSKTQPGVQTITPPTIHRSGFENNVVTTTEAFTFDQAGRLTSFLNIGHQYDAHGHRVATVSPGWGTRYQVYSRGGELLYAEDLGAQQRTEFFHLNGTLVAERNRPTSSETATVNYLHSDHRGTPTVKSAASGSRVYRSRLKPYGEPYDGIWREGPGFTKHAMDEAGNLVYMQQRYYDPVTQGFLSPDSVGATAKGFNRYWYAAANPYSYVDPDGRDEENAYGIGVAFALRNSPEKLAMVRRAEVAAGRDDAVAGIDAGQGFLAAAKAVSNGGGIEEVKAAVSSQNIQAEARRKSKRPGDFTPGQKEQAKRDNAAANGGQMKCTDCAKDVKSIANEKGVSTPDNQAQIHHDPAIQNGGGRDSKAIVLCPPCHIKRHTQEKQ